MVKNHLRAPYAIYFTKISYDSFRPISTVTVRAPNDGHRTMSEKSMELSQTNQHRQMFYESNCHRSISDVYIFRSISFMETMDMNTKILISLVKQMINNMQRTRAI